MSERNELARQLAVLWSDLCAYGATVNQIPLYSPPHVLRARIAYESQRVRALGERSAA